MASTWFESNLPAGTAAAGATDPSAPYAGTFTGGGQYPLASVMGTGFMQPWTTPFQGGPNFQAPTDVTQQNDPGWDFRLKEGLKAIENSAAAKGIGLGPRTMKELTRYAQNYASGEYGNVYNRASSEWDRNYNRSLGEYQQANSIYNNNANTQWGRLGNLSSAGLQAAGMNAGTGSSYANAMSTLYGTYGNALSGGIEDAANAWGAGQVGAANATKGIPASLADLFGKFLNWYGTQPTAPLTSTPISGTSMLPPATPGNYNGR